MKHSETMPFERYLELLDAYGADFGRWPEAERKAGELLALSSPDAQQARREAAGLDAALEELPTLGASAALRASIEAIPSRHSQQSEGVVWPFATVRWPALALAAALLLGIGTGSLVFGTALDDSNSSATAMSSNDWEELNELAFATHLEEENWP